MSWFSHLFGEDNQEDREKHPSDYLSHHSDDQHRERLVPQSNDVYERPRGKFRFPIDMHDETSSLHNSSKINETQNQQNHETIQKQIKPSYSFERGERRHRNSRNAIQKSSRLYHEKQNVNQKLKSQSSSHYNYSNHDSKAKRRQHFQDIKPTYHHKAFKASEVPSAIFGTKEPKAFANSGLNQPPGTRRQHGQTQRDNQNQQTNRHATKHTYRPKTPNYSKKDNTINIENVYASQIVEEIRREREKKVLQKKRFKAALEKERALKENGEHSDIEKAMNDMYANQAKYLLGDEDKKEEIDVEHDSIEKSNESHLDTSEIHQEDSQNDTFEYEELDLSEIKDHDESETDELNDENDSISVTTHAEKDNMLSEALDDTKEDAQNSTVQDIEVQQSNEFEPPQLEVKNNDVSSNATTESVSQIQSTHEVDSKSDEPHEEAQPKELEAPKLLPENHQSESHTKHYNDDSQSVEAETKHSDTTVPLLKPDLSSETEGDENRDLDDRTNVSSNDHELNEERQPSSTSKSKIRRGSKPFNVVMTPSDKRRLNQGKKITSQKVETQTTSTQNEKFENIEDQLVKTNTEIQTANLENDHLKQEHATKPVIQGKGTDSEQSTAIRRGPNLKLPSLDLLEDPIIQERDEAWIQSKKEELNESFYYFNVPAEVVNVIEGPSVTRFELSVEKGVKVSRITALQDDIKMALAAKDIRIEAPIPGTSLVGIEVPNQSPTKVNLKSILETDAFKNAESKLTVAMGNRINNEPLLMDIAKTPHALIAGATGSGKSVSINSILISLLYRNHPEELKLLLIDPKMVELAPYNDLPHLVAPVITDVKAATQSLKWAVDEMEKRYKMFAQKHVRNISAYNKKVNYDERIPKIVIVIDELADLMMMAPQEVEQSISRIAQKARACGIHMLVATQRPSVNVITGLIKANIPTRIAFMVSSSVDSRTIIDSGGAERLLGYGDMLYLGGGMNKPIRVQGTFVSDEEIDSVVDFIKSQREPEYLFQEKELLKKTEEPVKDELFDDVCAFMVQEKSISTSLIQRHFQIGYNRAARIIDQLEQLGYISGANGSKPRDVYLTESELNEI
ncbi:DNA translocase FtsK [Staphylococcus canis]|uniref:DNA translocase FtsK n=1 Tax=Staphylococcus canis TaxID=2724942 RepID=A0ABS0T690_9STAP|nr:DNA translocase FtsK [Staphylococcus canis]MBI5974265.1 DNA translocase FtsK [Staphylococcus canis]